MERSRKNDKTPALASASAPAAASVWKNEIGQMSVFIALLFQVLFVLFAMVINIGMLVHDKINLQNAVDLAAYYGAQRQAEILNEIAHLNYQIRQDYKLLSWRYRVLGTLGRQGRRDIIEDFLPPARKHTPGDNTEKEWINPAYPKESAADQVPAACVSNNMWSDFASQSTQSDDYCWKGYGVRIPPIPDVVQIAPFVPLVSVSAGFTKQAQAARMLSFQQAGPRNWAFMAEMFFAYKQSIALRKQAILALRKMLTGEMQDREGQSVQEGVIKTLKKNLSKANEEGLQDNGVQFLNGLSLGNCTQGDGATTIQEILTAPMFYFVYYDKDGTSFITHLADFKNKLDMGEVAKWDPTGALQQIVSSEPEATSPFASSLGYEKNPWCMAYVGVKAQSAPHKPFAPFGSTVTIEARGFAQPFGGRVGPWYRERWTSGSPNSSQGDRVDALTSPRLNAGALDSQNAMDRLPNYSRFPGDTLGLKSMLALGAQRKVFTDYQAKDKGQRLWLKYFFGFDQIATTGDPLASDGNSGFGGGAGPLRRAEVSAVSPDLFDATYYSVDPSFYLNYASVSAQRLQGGGGGNQAKEFQDLGGKTGDQTLATYNVENQINDSLANGFDPGSLNNLFWVLRSWTHLLTAWSPNRATNFDFPEARFGKCTDAAKDQLMIPGKCIAGGRIGYSVRLVSRSALMSQNWKVGGDGEAPGPILNPPDPGF